MLTPENRKKCEDAVHSVKKEVADCQLVAEISEEDNSILATCILTLDFFLARPFDVVAVNRMQEEIELCNRVLTKYSAA